jgi:hypothetical protein
MGDVAPEPSANAKGKRPVAKLVSVQERDRLEQEKQERRRTKQNMRDREVEDARKGILNDTPTKHTPTPTPTPTVEEVLPNPRSYFLTDGTETNDNPMFKIHSYLRAQPGGYDRVTMDKFRDDLGIDLKDPRNSELLGGLLCNELIDVGDFTLKRRQPLGVENEATMHHLFTFDLPNQHVQTENGLSAIGISEKQLVGAFDGADMCIDEMVKDGIVQEICSQNGRSSRSERVFFPAVKGMPAPPQMRDIWHSIEVPGEADLKQYLLKNGLRTPAEYQARKERNKERRDLEQAVRDERKQQMKDEKKAERDNIKFNEMFRKRGWDWMIH